MLEFVPIGTAAAFYAMIGYITGAIGVCKYDLDDDSAILAGVFWPLSWLFGAMVGFLALTKALFKGLLRLFTAASNKLGGFHSYLKPFHLKKETKWLAKGIPSPTYTLCGMLSIRMVKYPDAWRDWNKTWEKDKVSIEFNRNKRLLSLQVNGETISTADHPDGAKELEKALVKVLQIRKERAEEEARIAAEKKSTDAIEHLLKLEPRLPKPHVGTYETPCTLSCCKDKETSS